MVIDLEDLQSPLPRVGPRTGSSNLTGAVVIGVDPRSRQIVGSHHGLTVAQLEEWGRLLPALHAEWSSAVSVVPAPIGHDADLLVLVGLDQRPAEPSTAGLRRAAGAAARAAAGVSHLVFALPATSEEEHEAVLEGGLLGGYVYRGRHAARARTAPDVRSFELVPPPSAATTERAMASADAVRLTRTLVNMPPNELSPDVLATLAAEIAERSGIAATIWSDDDLRADGFGGILAVGQGSSRAPRLVRLDYRPESARAHLALVGKGITFDSGGLNLKLSELDYMNFDMAGAASVLATVVAAARLRLPVRVTAWLALAENMPSGSSQRPSDVIQLRDGTTVEVRDTDAEGRLVMADAMIAACLEGPDVLCDIATLTGAQQVALGDRIAALMSNDEALASGLLDVMDSIDEPLWRMPLPAQLRAGLDSRVADIANKAGRNGGMLTAALFLEEFVKRAEKVPAWAHLDICGPAINRDAPHGFTGLGATGFGVRTMLALARSLASA